MVNGAGGVKDGPTGATSVFSIPIIYDIENRTPGTACDLLCMHLCIGFQFPDEEEEDDEEALASRSLIMCWSVIRMATTTGSASGR